MSESITVHIHVHTNTPVMTLEKFGKESGLDQKGRKSVSAEESQVVIGLAKNNHLPTTKLGRHIMVNMVEYTAELAIDLAKNFADQSKLVPLKSVKS